MRGSRRPKRWYYELATVLVACAAFGAAATISDNAITTRNGRRVAVMIPGTVRFFEVELEAMHKAAQRAGLDLVVFDAGWDETTQIEQIDRALAENVDLVALASVDHFVVDNAVRLTKAAGVPLMTFTNGNVGDPNAVLRGLTVHVGRNEFLAGQLLAQQVDALDLIQPRILLIEGAPDTTPQELRHEGFMSIASVKPQWSITDTQTALRWSADEVEKNLLDALSTSRFNVVATQWADAGTLVAKILHERGRSDVKVVSLEWTKAIQSEMSATRIQSSTYASVRDEGTLRIETASKVLNGKRVPRFVEVEQVIVHAADADTFRAEW